MSVDTDPMPSLAGSEAPHIMDMDGTRVYANPDRYAYFELDSEEIKGLKLDSNQTIELEKWIVATTKRSISYTSKKELEPD